MQNGTQLTALGLAVLSSAPFITFRLSRTLEGGNTFQCVITLLIQIQIYIITKIFTS